MIEDYSDVFRKENELAFYKREDALKVADIMLNNGYVIMLSEEEELTIINYVDAGDYDSYLHRCIADRNNVVFLNAEDFESFYFKEEGEEDAEYDRPNRTDPV